MDVHEPYLLRGLCETVDNSENGLRNHCTTCRVIGGGLSNGSHSDSVSQLVGVQHKIKTDMDCNKLYLTLKALFAYKICSSPQLKPRINLLLSSLSNIENMTRAKILVFIFSLAF